MIEEPVLTVLLYSCLAAAAAVIGVVPQAVSGRIPAYVLGWANALASGLMIGVAYMLLTEGLQEGLAAGGVGALLGIGFVRATHALTGTGELDMEELEEAAPGYGGKVLLADTLHAAHEGVAIGAAMAVSLPLGVAMAATLAVHNIPEALILARGLSGRGLALPQTAGLAVASNLNQVVFAVGTFMLAAAAPVLLPWVTGFAVGAFLYLVLVELLPESYRQAGTTSIALVTLIALGVVILLVGLV